MTHYIKPLVIAFKGKGSVSFLKRVWTIIQRYGLTASKMDRALNILSQILQQYNCKATLPITAVALARSNGIIQKYQDQGIEFAVHGYRHVDHSQLSLAEQMFHFDQAGQIFREKGIHYEGFRCPYLRWNEHTLPALSQTDFVYDSSLSLVWDVDQKYTTATSYHRVLEFYGAEPAEYYPALPFLDRDSNLVRIPYCLPDDESLVERLNWSSTEEMNQIWLGMFHQIHERGELFTLGLHPERITNCLDALILTLQEVQTMTSQVWCTHLAEIATWWQARYVAQVDISNIRNDILQVTVNGPRGTTLLMRSIEAETTTEPWFNGYQKATEQPCRIHINKRPFIGVSPKTDPALISFLKQQGYIVETSLDASLYAFYIDQSFFLQKDERNLIIQIEKADFPLVRLGRWPNDARSALVITGDIDALTIWDYGSRIFGQ